MTFLELQTELQELIGDTRAEWQPTTGANLKKAVIYGVKTVFDRLKQNANFLEQNYTETTLSLSDKKATLPADYSTVHEVLLTDNIAFDPEGLNPNTLYEYSINKKDNTIVFINENDIDITFRYIIEEPALVNDLDEPNLADHWKDAVVLASMEQYHRKQFDRDNIPKSVAYSEEKLEDLINKNY